MKRKLFNVLVVTLIFSVIMLSGCIKNNDSEVPPVPSITGTFEGVFKKLRKRTSGPGYDTVIRANINLRIKADSGYTLLSDTAIHANSNGEFVNNYNYIQFADKTFKDTSKKYHLHGIYGYYYDTNRLQVFASQLDTVGFIYDLKKK